MMFLLFCAAYLMIASFGIAMTMHEHNQRAQKDVAGTTLGIVGCLFWPATVAAVGVAATRSARDRS